MPTVDWGLNKAYEAEFNSICGHCDEPILQGDLISEVDGEWLHETCAESAREGD